MNFMLERVKLLHYERTVLLQLAGTDLLLASSAVVTETSPARPSAASDLDYSYTRPECYRYLLNVFAFCSE
jgi:hypothetical protein